MGEETQGNGRWVANEHIAVIVQLPIALPPTIPPVCWGTMHLVFSYASPPLPLLHTHTCRLHLDPEDKARVERLEVFDEFEEWHMIQVRQ
jgi:hypothetical protein